LARPTSADPGLDWPTGEHVEWDVINTFRPDEEGA